MTSEVFIDTSVFMQPSRHTGIGTRLSDLRTLAGISARGLSKLAGLSEVHVRTIELRDRDIDTSTAARLATVLGTSLDWLVMGKGTAPRRRKVRAAVEAAKAQAGVAA